MQVVPLQLPPSAAPPARTASPPPRPYIEEAPYVEVPTRMASMDDWPTDHPAAALFRSHDTSMQPRRAPVDRSASRATLKVFALTATCAVLAGAGLAWWMFGGRRSSGAAAGPASAAPDASDVPVGTVPSAAPSVASPEPGARVVGDGGASSAVPSATVSAPVSSSSAGAAPLLSFEAALTVRSSVDAEVVVQGVDAGRTNQLLRVRCGPRNVRLRADDGRWLTAGRASSLPCMRATTLELEPNP